MNPFPPAERDTAAQRITFQDAGVTYAYAYRSGNSFPAPKRVVFADDRTTADQAFRLASEGVGLVWRGDFHNARQLLQALARRIERKAAKPAETLHAAFLQQRQRLAQRARTLNMLLLEATGEGHIGLRRAPDTREALEAAFGVLSEPYLLSLRELQGAIGAHEWRKKGIWIDALSARIHPHYGVFAPTRQEYLALVADTPLPPGSRAFELGVGTGVLSAILARRGVAEVVATDIDPRALGCAQDNLSRLGCAAQVRLEASAGYPAGRASLILCNPPWLPGRPTSTLERGIYDENSAMLKGFLGGLATHLDSGGEGWLILSDLAEHLGLRSRETLLGWIGEAGLKVLERRDVRPVHPRAQDTADPLAQARSQEVTSLWRLAPQSA